MTMHQWDDGEDRREYEEPPVTLEKVMAMLHKVNAKIEKHMEEEDNLRPKVEELIDILQKSKGVITFIKVLVYVGGIVAAIVVWAKDHLK